MYRILRSRAVAFGAFLAVAIVAACQSNPATELLHNSKANIDPPCPLGGCNAPDLDVRFDSAWADSVSVGDDTVFWAGDGILYTAWHVGPNPDDTSITVSIQAVANCVDPAHCGLEGYYEEPNPITLDPDESTGICCQTTVAVDRENAEARLPEAAQALQGTISGLPD